MQVSEHPEGATVLCRCKKCNDIAFYLRQRIESGGFFKASNVILIDGTEPEPCSMAVCGSCKCIFSFRLNIAQEDIA